MIASGARALGAICFLRRFRNITSSAINPIPTTAAAIPIPARAPVDRSPEVALTTGKEGVEAVGDVVEAVGDVVEEVEVAWLEEVVIELPIFHPVIPTA